MQPPDNQQPQQGNTFMRVEQLAPRFPRVVGENPRFNRVENQTLPTLRVEPILPQIHILSKTQYHTNNNDTTGDFTGRSTDVTPPLYRYPTRSKFIKVANHIATVTPDAIFYPRHLLMNVAIHPETVSEK